MAFPTNPLERVLRDVMERRAPFADLLRALADATLIVPTTGLVGSGQDRAEMEVVEHEGRPYVVAFTSADQHAYWRGGTGQYVLLTGRQLGEGWPGDVGLAVNPGGDAGLPLPADTVRALAGPVRTIAAGTTIRVGEPAAEPVAVLDAVAAALPGAPEVATARRALVDSGDGRPSIVVALEVDAGGPDAERAAVEAAAAAIRAAAPELPVDVLCFRAGGADGLAAEIVRTVEPFYRRGLRATWSAAR